LSVNNEFLSNEVERLRAWIAAYSKEIHAEIESIEASANADGKTISAELKAVVDHIRAKL
jgi:hypothetical protein